MKYQIVDYSNRAMADAVSRSDESVESRPYLRIHLPFDLIFPDPFLHSNHVFMNVVEDRLPGRAMVLVAIDNLVKGASGQAIQNMNIMFDLPEEEGLDMAPMFP